MNWMESKPDWGPTRTGGASRQFLTTTFLMSKFVVVWIVAGISVP